MQILRDYYLLSLCLGLSTGIVLVVRDIWHYGRIVDKDIWLAMLLVGIPFLNIVSLPVMGWAAITGGSDEQK